MQKAYMIENISKDMFVRQDLEGFKTRLLLEAIKWNLNVFPFSVEDSFERAGTIITKREHFMDMITEDIL